MSFKDKKEKFLKWWKEDDFHAELLDHELGNQNYYRLHYINYHNIDGKPGGRIDWPYKPFELPSGMSREEGFKVLSYLTDFIEKCDYVGVASWKSVEMLDGVIDLERFGFKRLNFIPGKDEVIDLFTVSGRIRRFKESEYYSTYFNWYTPNIAKEEVEKIYQNCGLFFSDIVWQDKSSKDSPKVNIKQKKFEG